ncbi:outer spore coat protein CotE [Haloplasma contractile]|uniref:Spore coat protein E n=1 Tax=Haloplasma contractile SSD-17B TaxID=1033810 RepID=U2EFF1_9MOLU|nr:outer spore coat protein CotE [Haloplasma contractile]ERJ13663.1 Spore coat protein E [Haloplasma contractile SSD-17B]
MNEIREIVTKAIVEKGKKTIRFTERIRADHDVESILGCWVLNNKFEARKVDNTVELRGVFELNAWYAYDDNTKTDVAKERVGYQQNIRTRRKVENYIEGNNDVVVKMVRQPVCTDARIVDGLIEVEIMFEVIAEVIGETKMRVSILNQPGQWDDDDDYDLDDEIEDEIEEEINEKFLRDHIL